MTMLQETFQIELLQLFRKEMYLRLQSRVLMHYRIFRVINQLINLKQEKCLNLFMKDQRKKLNFKTLSKTSLTFLLKNLTLTLALKLKIRKICLLLPTFPNRIQKIRALIMTAIIISKIKIFTRHKENLFNLHLNSKDQMD